MSDEPEARMWEEDQAPHYEDRGRGAFYESAFASSEHLDRAPLLGEETYTDVAVGSEEESEHCHWRSKQEPASAVPQLLTALLLCFFFMICELFGGYLAGSISVMSDAAHMLSDCGGFALALLAFRCAQRPPDARLSYGYRRAEVLGAMVSVLLIWALTAVFVYVAAVRLYSGDYSVSGDAMMLVSGCGVAFNVVLALVLHGCCSSIAHHHSHGGAACHAHSHASQTHVPWFSVFGRGRGRKPVSGVNGTLVNGEYSVRDIDAVEADATSGNDRNINLRAAFIHVIGDLIQSCGVLLASIVIKLYPSAKFVDPLCTFVFSLVVLVTSARVVRDALAMLMQAVPPGFRYAACVRALGAVPGVRHVHDVHCWALSTHHAVLTAHLAIDSLTEPESVLRECRRLARDVFGAQAATFQVERYSPPRAACAACAAQPCARA